MQIKTLLIKSAFANLILIIGLILFFAANVLAATITVTNTNDSGAGSLRDAIAASVSGDTIDFNLTGCPCVISLTSSELSITNRNIFINGPGASQLTISGNNARRVLRIGGISGSSVTISGLTIANGSVTSGSGGGIYVENGTLTLSNSVVTGNSASNSSTGYGGGIYTDIGNPLNILDSTITNNSSGAGGGGISTIFATNAADTLITIKNSTISDNSSRIGGGILIGTRGFLTAINSNFTNNTANVTPADGGGIYNSGSITILGGTINLNDATGNTARGGGIFNNSGSTSSLSKTTVTLNTATANGGGIFNSATFNISESTISSNQSVTGAGINNDGTGNLTVTNSTISGNNLATSGAGINNGGTLRLTNSTISGNQATGAGGGILQTSGNASLISCTIATNSAGNGGGFFNISTVTVQNTIIAQNTAGSNPDVNVNGGFTSQGFNLIGISTGNTGFTNGTNNDIVGTSAIPVNPLLDALAENGGATRTHALQSASPAIDKGNNVYGLATDQRGNSRFTDSAAANIPGGNNSDIGAFEFAAPTAASVGVSGKVLTSQNRGIRNATVLLIDSNGDFRSVTTGTFGSFRFSNVAIGETYVLIVRSKTFRFAPQIVTISEELTNFNLTAEK